jgi:hypothetical protein
MKKTDGVQKKYYSVAMNKSRRSILDGFLIDFDGLWMDFAGFWMDFAGFWMDFDG